MKVITLERIKDFVEDRHGKQVVSKINIKGCDKKSGVVVIHDAGTEKLRAFINGAGELEFVDEHDRIHCILLETDLEDFNAEHPFIKCREALAGYLVIDGETPSEEELRPYLYTLQYLKGI